MSVMAEAIGAAQGGLLGLLFTMPIETVQKRQVAQKNRGDDSTSLQIAAKIWEDAGLLGFYRGCGVLGTMVANEKFIYYLLYTWMKNFVEKRRPLGLASNILLGYLSDLGRLPVTMPLDLVSTRMQTSATGSITKIADDVLKQSGPTGFYAGWKAYVGMAIKPAIQILIFEQVKRRLNRGYNKALSASLSFRDAFWLGALARLIATLICYPFFFARISAQSGVQGGVLAVLGRIYKAKGLAGVYSGLAPELMRGILFHAVNMATMEQLRAFNTKLLRGPGVAIKAT